MIIVPTLTFGTLMTLLMIYFIGYIGVKVSEWVNDTKQAMFDRKVARLEARKLREELALQKRFINQAKETQLRKQRYYEYLRCLAEDPDIDKRIAVYQRMIRNYKKREENQAI